MVSEIKFKMAENTRKITSNPKNREQLMARIPKNSKKNYK